VGIEKVLTEGKLPAVHLKRIYWFEKRDQTMPRRLSMSLIIEVRVHTLFAAQFRIATFHTD
jgi:hypothetical protein